MSAHGWARTKDSSQAPRTRAPPRGSTSGSSRRDRSSSWEEEIPFSAVTSTTSRPQGTAAPATEGRRKSNVTFAARSAPSVAPSDSISRVKTNRSSGKTLDREASRISGRSYRSRASRTSSQNGTAWSGDGEPLTSTNLEKLNVIDENAPSQPFTTGAGETPRSDDQEQPRSTRRTVREYEVEADDDRQTSRRASRRNSYAQSNNYQTSRAATQRYSTAFSEQKTSRNVDATTVDSGSSSRTRERATSVSRNVIDVDSGESRATETRTRRSSRATTNAAPTAPSSSAVSPKDADGAQSQSRAATQSRSQSRYRNDEATQAAEAEVQKSQAATKSATPGTTGPSKSSSVSGSRQPGPSTATGALPDLSGNWERRVHVTTKRYANGREVQEREIHLVTAAAAA